MRQFFIGLAGSPDMDELVGKVDEVALEFGIVPQRSAPVHATIVAPRLTDQLGCIEAQSIVDLIANTERRVMAFSGPLQAWCADGVNYLIAPLEGVGVAATYELVLNRFYSRFGGERQEREGVSPHVTLLTSRGMTDSQFDDICQCIRAKQLYVRRTVNFSKLVLFEREEGEPCYEPSFKADLQHIRDAAA